MLYEYRFRAGFYICLALSVGVTALSINKAFADTYHPEGPNAFLHTILFAVAIVLVIAAIYCKYRDTKENVDSLR